MLTREMEFFRELYDRGIRFEATDGELQVTAPSGVLTDELKKEIAANKEQLLGVMAGAAEVLNCYGVRLIGRTVGLWRAADLPEVRTALKAIGFGEAEVLYLDDPDAPVPDRFRVFVPARIQEIWDRAGILGTPADRIAAERKARRINFIFDELGRSLKPSRIKSETVLHGELAKRTPKA